MVANQDVRWRTIVGPFGDPNADLNDKQYMMLEAICRSRTLGEWQFILAKQLKMEARNMYYHRMNLSKQGLLKKRVQLLRTKFIHFPLLQRCHFS